MDKITITISAQTLNTIGAGLQELPYKVASPAIQEIDKQVQAFLAEKDNARRTRSDSEIGDADGA